MQHTDFPCNLRLLCDHYPSVADICRRLGINRSQFNKYLSGKSVPSRHSLKRICDFFGVEAYEISLPRDQFQRVIAVRPDQPAARGERAPHHLHLDELLAESRERLAMYLGFYYEYYYSMSSPGMVLRSLVYLADAGQAVYYRRYERLVKPGQGGPLFRCDYRGVASFLSDRIFLTDYESLTRNEVSHTILYPTYKSRVGRLSGVKLGVSSGYTRPPACCRVLWEYLGPVVHLRRALSMCRLYDPRDGEIDREILEAVDNRVPVEGFHFLATPTM